MRPANRGESDSEDSESSLSFDLEKEYAAKHQQIIRKRIEQSKKETLIEKKKQKEKERLEAELDKVKLEQAQKDKPGINLPRLNEKESLEVFTQPKALDWFIYPKCPELDIMERVPSPMNKLPIFRKKEEIMDAITKNQFVLVTGQTGCGKSTQVPRLIYEYLLKTEDKKSKIMCVQPRRIAVMNLHSILDRQMKQPGQIGYQIGMKSQIYHSNRIVFVTNGIFLQRLVHSTEFFDEYPFIILDQVHERDIDTDFILLTIKRVIRLYPKVRIVLMSATIDNHLFRYYFASDHIDKILTEKNYYLRIAEAREQERVEKQEKRKMRRRNSSGEEEEMSESNSQQEEERLQKKYGFGFLNAKHPCPAINVTEPGKFTREYYYLDTMKKFLPSGVTNNSWGGVVFSDKYPSTNRELYETVALIIDELLKRKKDERNKSSVLIFMPGLAEIEQLNEYITDFFRADNVKKYMELLNVHSTILNDEISKKLLEKTGSRHKIIIATNIAESSITVLGVEYVIDFCLSKEVRFDQRSRMENLELVWASKASCNQRAGRTGRVCNGTIFRLVEKKFYDNLKDYSEPEIQRSSLDKLILRIKLLHEGEGQSARNIFAEPGQVLGSAIQPPKLKNIDTAIKSLKFSGGLQEGKTQGEFQLTNLGRLYIDIPIDIAYCKLLVVSQLFGTYNDMLNLVSILSQSKNVIRRGTIDRNYKNYYETCSTPYNCDFLGLLILYENGKRDYRNSRDEIYLDVYKEIQDMKRDIDKRIQRKRELFPMLQFQEQRRWRLKDLRRGFNKEMEDYLYRFKMTLICGFINNMLIVKHETLTEKQEKRLALMKKVGIRHENTICLLNAKYLKKPSSQEAEERLKSTWQMHLAAACNIPSPNMSFTLTLGLTYLHFKEEDDLHKFLYFRAIEESKKLPYDPDMPNPATKRFVSTQEIVSSFGEMDHMHAGRVMTFQKDQTVAVDSYSLNRVININEGAKYKYLITNNLSKSSSRMKARFTSQLPLEAKHLEAVSQLLFYPFVRLSTTFQKSRYDFILLGKSKKGRLPRTRVPIRFILTNKDIMEANVIRVALRKYLSLNIKDKEQFTELWNRIDAFLSKERQDIVESDKWQKAYLDHLKAKRPQMEQILKDLFEGQGNCDSMVPQGDDMSFMNEIRTSNLKFNYFSDIVIAGMTRQQRERDYNLWKLSKMREVRAIESRVYDTNSYLACGEGSCALKICPMVKVGPTNQMIYRQLFGYIEQNVRELPFNVSDPNHFCNMLQSNYLEWQFSTWGCQNEHYFAIKFEHENKLRIVPFSELMIIYPDGSSERADFKNLDIKHWKKTHDKKLMDKYKITISTYCFVCDEIVTTFKLLEQHVRDTKHTDNMREFVKTLPQEMQEKPKVIKDIEDDNNSVY